MQSALEQKLSSKSILKVLRIKTNTRYAAFMVAIWAKPSDYYPPLSCLTQDISSFENSVDPSVADHGQRCFPT